MTKRKTIIGNFYRVIKLVWSYDRNYILAEFTLNTIKSLLPLLLAWYSALFINKITTGNFTSLYDTGLISIVIIYLSLPLLISLADVWYQYFFNKFYLFFQQYINLMFIDKKYSIDIQTYEDADFNNLITRVRENEDKLLWFSDWLLYLFGKTIELISIIFILFSYHWWILPLLILALIPDLIVQIKFGSKK